MVFGGTRRRGLNNTPMSVDGSLLNSLSTPLTLCEHLRDEQPIRSVPEHDEDFDIVSRTTYECLSFGRQKKQKRQGAVFRTGSPPKSKGLFSERGPHRKKFRWGICAPCNPKTPHTPTNEKRSEELSFAPCLRGQRGFVNKRKKEMGASIHQKTRRR